MLKAVIFDIDGTLADASHRMHLIQTRPKKWKEFFELVHLDQPVWPIVQLYRTLVDAGHPMIICSGRPENYRKPTVEWLLRHEINGWERIFMRKKGDYRADDIVKEEFLDEILRRGFEIEFVVDDRKRVVDMWRRRGLLCLQVAEGNF